MSDVTVTGSRLPVEFTDEQIKKLNAPTPPEMIKEVRKGGGTFKYVPHSFITEKLNEIFRHRWTFEVKEWKVWEVATKVIKTVKKKVPKPDSNTDFIESTEYVEEIVMVPDQVTVIGTLKVMMGDGIVITKEQVGTSHIKRYKPDHATRPNQAIDIGNDIKSAASDAKKKCASELGLCLDVYAPVLDEYYNMEEKRQTIEDMTELLARVDLCESMTELERLKPEIAKQMEDMDGTQKAQMLEKCVEKAKSLKKSPSSK